MSNKRKLHWLYMYGECWHLKLNMFLKQSIWSTNKILREIAVLECENAKNVKFVFGDKLCKGDLGQFVVDEKLWRVRLHNLSLARWNYCFIFITMNMLGNISFVIKTEWYALNLNVFVNLSVVGIKFVRTAIDRYSASLVWNNAFLCA